MPDEFKNASSKLLAVKDFMNALILGMPYIANIPGMLEGLADLIPTVLGKGGGVQ